MDNFLLVLLLVVPLAGAVVCALLPSDGRLAKGWALLVSLATAAVAAVLAVQFPWGDAAGVIRYGGLHGELFHLEPLGVNFSLSADAVSMWLVGLTVFLQPLAIAASFESITDRRKEYYAWMLVLLAAMLGVFVAGDLILFYVFFELTLIPMFFIIGIWGGPERRAAAGKFFLFTFTGSVFTLAGVVYLGARYGTFAIDQLIPMAQGQLDGYGLTQTARFWILLAFLAGFAVKVPLFPVHTWLPLAHTEAPTAGSVILAGVLLKLGTFGLYRLAVPLGLLDATGVAFPGMVHFIGVMCLVGIVYGSLVAWVQQDIKKLVAYSSVAHLGFCVLGLVALNDVGVQGSVLYMVNHGLSTGAMFLVIGMIYDRYHTRDINELSGLARRMPVMAFFFVLFVLSSIGLPGLNGFVSEFLTILGAFTSGHLGLGYGFVAATGILLGAIYMLHMTARVIFGPLKVPALDHAGHGHTAHGTAHGQADQGQAATPGHGGAGHDHGHGDHGAPGDLNLREIGILVPLAIVVIVLGLRPNLLLRSIEGPVQAITRGDHGPAAPGTATAAAPLETATVARGAPGASDE